MRKSVAGQHVAFQMISTTDGSDVTTGTPTVYYTIDAGTQGTGSGTIAHEGNGQWSYSPASAETNGNHVAFTMVLSGAVSQTVNVYPVSFDPTDSVRMGMTALPNAAADAAGGLPVSDAGGLDLDTMNSTINTTSSNVVTVDTVVDAIKVVTDAIGATGTGLTAIPWNAAWDAEVQSEADDALVARGLHYLVNTALPTNWSTDITANSALDYMADDGTAVYDRTTDSLQAIADSGGGGPTAAQIADAVWDEAQADHVAAGSFGEVATEVASILADTGTDGVVIAAGQSVASVSGAVGSVTGNVGGNVTGSVGSISGVTFPTNFSSMVISGAGAVDSLVQGFLNNTIAETTADNIAANFETFFDNGNALTSKIVNDVGVAGSGLTAQQVWEYNISAIATAGYAGTVLNARASQTSVDTIDGIVDAILADTGTDGVVIAAGQSVASVTGAVGSVTGNVGGSVASVTGTVGGIAGTITTLDALDTAQDTQHSTTQSLITTVDTVVDGIQTDLDNGTDGLGAIKTAVDAISVSASPVLIQTTTIATLTSQTVFTLTAGSSDDDAYNGLTIVITDSATSTQKAVGTISDYVGSTKTVTLRVDPGIFTMAAGDTVSILAAVNGAVTGSATGVGWLG